MSKKTEKIKKEKLEKKKRFHVVLFAVGGLIAAYLVLGVFLFFYNPSPAKIYVYPESVKQGDTIFIKVESKSNNVSGFFENEKLVFYKKADSNEWISFLGIDADQKPGDYKIDISDSLTDQQTKNIKVYLASFSPTLVTPAPASNQNNITNQQAVSNILKNDNPAIKKVMSNLTASPYFSQPFSYPLSLIERSGFSFGKFIGFGKYALQHMGVDLAASEKTKIYAVNNGKVVATLNLENYGKTIIVDHGLNIFSMYLHLDDFKVSVGQIVKQGQMIGLSGDTGYVTAPHLHFSMRVNGARIDPLVFIKTSQKINDNPVSAALFNAFNYNLW